MADQYFVDICVKATGRVCRTTHPMPLEEAEAARGAKAEELAGSELLTVKMRRDERPECPVCQCRMFKVIKSHAEPDALYWKCDACEKKKREGEDVRGKGVSWGT
jgi:ribosomal protein L37AE/L43A